MSHIIVTRTMNATAEQVWEAVSNLARIADWNRTCASSTWLGEPAGLGGRAVMEMYDGSELRQEVTSHDPANYRLGYSVEGLPMPMATLNGEWLITPTANGCEVSFENEYTLKGGIFGVAIDRLVLRAAIRREHQRILDDLDHHVMTGELIGKGGARSAARAQAASAAA